MARGKATIETTTQAEDAISASIVHIANQHTGHIMFPRKGAGGITVDPLILPPGTTTAMDKEEWEARKAGQVVQHYLDRGLLAEVKGSMSNIPVDPTSTELPIPENLQGEEQEGAYGQAKVRSDKSRTGEIKVG